MRFSHKFYNLKIFNFLLGYFFIKRSTQHKKFPTSKYDMKIKLLDAISPLTYIYACISSPQLCFMPSSSRFFLSFFQNNTEQKNKEDCMHEIKSYKSLQQQIAMNIVIQGHITRQPFFIFFCSVLVNFSLFCT